MPRLLAAPHQHNPGLVIQPGIGGIGNGFLLHRGIDVDPLHVLLGQASPTLGGLQGFAEQQFHFLGSDPLSPAGHGTRIERKMVNEILESAEILPVRVLEQSSDNRFVAFVKSMLEVMQPDQQSGRFGRASLLGIERTELFVKDRPIDLRG